MPNFADWTPVASLPPATEELHRRTRLLVLDGEPDRGFVCRKLDDGTFEWYEIVKEEPLATGGGHPDLADHELIGLVTETDLTTHAADATAVHGIADTANLVLTNDARLSDARTPTTHSITTPHSFPGGTTNFLREDGTFALPVGQHPNLATHDALGLATQAELDALDFEAAGAVAAHEANGNPHSVYATDTDLTTHAGAADPHTGYVQEAAVPGGELGGTYATPTVDATHSGSTHAATQAAAEATAASALTTHVGAADPHTGYLKENDANYVDLTDGGATTLHSHAGGGGGPASVKITADQTLTLASLVSITGLSFAVTSGVYYDFKFSIMFRSDTLTSGIRVGVTTPAFTRFAATARILFAADGAGADFQGALSTSGDAVIATAVPVINTDYLAIIEGVLLPSANGTLQAQAGEEVTAGVVTVRQGSVGLLFTIP